MPDAKRKKQKEQGQKEGKSRPIDNGAFRNGDVTPVSRKLHARVSARVPLLLPPPYAHPHTIGEENNDDDGFYRNN